MTTICPQCMKEVNESTNRLIQDTCGHKKCRICLLQDETSCKICDDRYSTESRVLIKKTEKSNTNDQKIQSKNELTQVCNNNKNNQNNDNKNETNIKENENIKHEFHNKIPHIIILSS